MRPTFNLGKLRTYVPSLEGSLYLGAILTFLALFGPLKYY